MFEVEGDRQMSISDCVEYYRVEVDCDSCGESELFEEIEDCSGNELIKNLCKTLEGIDMLIGNVKANREFLQVDENGLTLGYFAEIFGSEKDIPLPLRAYLGGKCLAAEENENV
jgi:hypothetical protein